MTFTFQIRQLCLCFFSRSFMVLNKQWHALTLIYQLIKNLTVIYLLLLIHFEITDYPCNPIGSQRCDVFPNRTIFCSKSHLFLSQ